MQSRQTLSLALIYLASHFITELHLVAHPLVKPRKLLLKVFLSLMCLEMVSRISCSITFTGIKVMVTNLQFPGFSFWLLLKTGVTFAFSPSLDTSLSYHYQAKTIETVLAMTYASSVSTCGCIPSGPTDLDMLFAPYLVLFHQGYIIFQSFTLAFGSWDS